MSTNTITTTTDAAVPAIKSGTDRLVSFPLPPELAGIEPPPIAIRHPILVGLIVILVAFGGIGFWTAMAPLESAVVAPGTLVVEGNIQNVQHLEGGIVKELLVRNGDYVERGDVLVRLEEVRALAESTLVGHQWAAMRALQSRLESELASQPSVAFPEDLLELARTNSEIHGLLAAQRQQFEERRKTLEGQVKILQARIVQLRQEITGLKVQKESKERQVTIFQDELKGLRDLFEKGYTPRTRILAMEREVAELEGEIGSAIAGIARAETSIGEADLQITQIRQEFRETAINQLRDVQVQTSDLRERMTVTSDVLQRTEIRAPHTGTIQNLQIHTVGGVIRSSEQLMQIVPRDAKLVIDAQVSPMDIDNVRVGQVAEVRFSAFMSHDIPAIHGDVVLVSADRLTDERTGMPYYSARLEIPDEELTKIGDRRLIPGMPAETFIKTGERTALNYFLKPIEQFGRRAMNEE